MTHDDLQLKRAIVNALPAVLYMDGDTPYWGVCDLDMLIQGDTAVRDTEWNYLVGRAFEAYITSTGRDGCHFAYFSPLASWREIADYLYRIGAIKDPEPTIGL